MRILALLTDAFGGFGGISVANRNFLKGLCQWEGCEEVVAIPRLMPEEPEFIPEKLVYCKDGLGGKFEYVKAIFSLLLSDREFGIIWCGHINLIPIAVLAKKITGAKLVLHMHGIDAWTPTESRLVNHLIQSIDYFISVSEVTKNRFSNWSKVAKEKGFVLPNTIDFTPFSPGPKDQALMERYKLEDNHYVLMTLGRLAGQDRKKGFDRVLEVLPRVLQERPETRYLIAGHGPDRPRLERLAEELGLREQVIFTGFVDEDKKAAHYRLADLYVMPSEGEGFGLVLLEAMACGIQVMASKTDGSQEALANGKLGTLVNPKDLEEIKEAIINPFKVDHIDEKVFDIFSTKTFNNRLNDTFDYLTK